MLGLGETDADVRALLHDLRTADVDVVTFGQYLRPTKRHISVQVCSTAAHSINYILYVIYTLPHPTH
jgi:lipoate synthase